jgi:Methyltransferase domain
MTTIPAFLRSWYPLGKRLRKRSSASPTMTEHIITRVAASAGLRREEIWVQIIEQSHAKQFLELGVLKGAFAEYILQRCHGIARYYMLDPWRHLEDWNKPANVDQSTFDDIYSMAMERTEFARDRRLVLRGRTTDMIDEIPDNELDIAYIDGDHTLRGIAIDLIRSYSKIRPGGILGGDDYTTTIWQHSECFEPSLVCPFAAYFAESQGAPIIILPHSQFAIIKPLLPGNYFRVIDTTKNYGDRVLLPQIMPRT